MLQVSDARNLKGLEEENAKLKKLLAEQMLGRGDAEEDAGKGLLMPGLRRAAVTWAMEQKNYSQRRACRLVGLEAKTYQYVSKRPGDDEIRAELRVLAGERRRFG